MAARIQILHGELPSSFGFKEGELYVNNSGELYFGIENSSSAMVFGSKFSGIEGSINSLNDSMNSAFSQFGIIDSSINSLNTSVTSLNSMIFGTPMSIVLKTELSGLIFEGQEIKPEHFTIVSNPASIDNVCYYFDYSTYPEKDNLILDGLWSGTKDSKNYSGKFSVTIGKTVVASFGDEVANNPARIPYIAQYGDPSKFWKAGDCAPIYFEVSSSEIYDIPLTILGFNHDTVSDPLTYGKKEAGMTLGIGGTRKVRHESGSNLSPDLLVASDWKTIFGSQGSSLFNTSGTSFKTPNNGGKFWIEDSSQESPLRTFLNNQSSGFIAQLENKVYTNSSSEGKDVKPIFDAAVAVIKDNAKCWKYDSFYSNSDNTVDKFFLLSENEVFGQQRFYNISNFSNISLYYRYDGTTGTNGNTTDLNYYGQIVARIVDQNKLKNLYNNTELGISDEHKAALRKYGYFFIKYRAGEPGTLTLFIPNSYNDQDTRFLSDVSIYNSNKNYINNFRNNYGIYFPYEIVNNVEKLKMPNDVKTHYIIWKIIIDSGCTNIAPATEGEQYEFFKDKGASKFFWSKRNLTKNGTVWNFVQGDSKILLRSTDNNIQKATSSNNSSIYNSAIETSSVNYNLALATPSDTKLDIYPCFCL